MSDAQTWTALGVLIALNLSMMAMTLRMMRVEIGALRTEVTAVRTELGAKIDHLDRDIQTVINRMMG